MSKSIIHDFPFKPASNKSLSTRKLIFGWGVNNAEYAVQPGSRANRLRCPYYVVWTSMLSRCFSHDYHKAKPTYVDCSVCDEWRYFMTFKEWMEKQDWRGNHLDKDILHLGNKHYSPENCIFVPREINGLIGGGTTRRHGLPKGVHQDKRTKTFRTTISRYGKRKHLGSFSDASEALMVYKKAKSEYIIEVAISQPEPIRGALLAYAGKML